MVNHVSRNEHVGCDGSVRTAWPLLRGLMSKKAYVFSLSKSFMDGISPAGVVRQVHGYHIGGLRRRGIPLMILQKMHAAAMLGGVCTVRVCVRVV